MAFWKPLPDYRQILRAPTRLLNYGRRHLEEMPPLKQRWERQRRQQRQEHRPHLPTLDPAYGGLLRSLQQEGACVTSLDHLNLPLSKALLAGAYRLLPQLCQDPSPPGNRFLVQARPQDLLRFPEIYLWGVQQPLLDLVEAYLGLPVAYHGVYLRWDLPQTPEAKSRLWHFDLEDEQSVKIIVYLNDVSEADGPFQYFTRETLAKFCDRSHLQFGYHSSQQLTQQLQSRPFISCCGAARTVVIADTAGLLHRGLGPTTGQRFSLFFDYTSRYPKRPYYCKSSIPRHQLGPILAHIEARARDCIDWRGPTR